MHEKEIYPPPPIDDPVILRWLRRFEAKIPPGQFLCLRCINSGIRPMDAIHMEEVVGWDYVSRIDGNIICGHCFETEEDYLKHEEN